MMRSLSSRQSPIELEAFGESMRQVLVILSMVARSKAGVGVLDVSERQPLLTIGRIRALDGVMKVTLVMSKNLG